MLTTTIYKVTGMTNTIIEDTMTDRKWLNPRIFYLQTFVKPLPTKCPECGSPLTTTIDEDETICTQCGLITSASIEYVAGTKIIYDYGRH